MGSEPGVGWRAKWSDRDLEENVKIFKLFDRFPQWFLMALRDVISGLLIRDQMRPNQTHYGSGAQMSPCMAFPKHSGPPVWHCLNVSWGKPI